MRVAVVARDGEAGEQRRRARDGGERAVVGDQRASPRRTALRPLPLSYGEGTGGPAANAPPASQRAEVAAVMQPTRPPADIRTFSVCAGSSATAEAELEGRTASSEATLAVKMRGAGGGSVGGRA